MTVMFAFVSELPVISNGEKDVAMEKDYLKLFSPVCSFYT